ncbi:MAG: single-stranded DNA-binding protein [Anaerolineae bacterium]|nr:single-stranded DNA-binding protein [Anaerolineae bacterium]
MSTYHEIEIIGWVGGKPEMRYTSDGTPVTNFSVAASRKYTDASGKQQKRTWWFNVTAWRRQAETCNEYLDKGMQVFVKGRLGGDRLEKQDGSTQIVPHTWTGKDGQPAAKFDVTAQVVHFLGRAGGGASAIGLPDTSLEPPPEGEGEAEIPF